MCVWAGVEVGEHGQNERDEEKDSGMKAAPGSRSPWLNKSHYFGIPEMHGKCVSSQAPLCFAISV